MGSGSSGFGKPAVVAGLGVALLALAVLSGTVLHSPEEGADIGGGLAGLLGVLLLLVGTGLGIGRLIARRRGR